MIYDNVQSFLKKHDLRCAKSKMVATSGAFDILHSGHIKLLQLCKRLGTSVVVLLNTDESVRTYKSEHRPIKDWQTRAELLDELRCVDFVVGLHDPTPIGALGLLKPHLWIKGDRPIEEIVEKEVLFNVGCDIIVIWNSEAGSSTDLIARAARAWSAEAGICIEAFAADIEGE